MIISRLLTCVLDIVFLCEIFAARIRETIESVKREAMKVYR